MASFEIRGSFYVMLRSEDDKVVLRSVEQHSEAECEAIARRIRHFAASPDRFERHASTGGGHYFTLRDDDGNVLGRSPTLASREDCDRAIAIVQEVVHRGSDEAGR